MRDGHPIPTKTRIQNRQGRLFFARRAKEKFRISGDHRFLDHSQRLFNKKVLSSLSLKSIKSCLHL